MFTYSESNEGQSLLNSSSLLSSEMHGKLFVHYKTMLSLETCTSLGTFLLTISPPSLSKFFSPFE